MNALARVAREDPTGRKVVVGPNRGVGRELLRRLALAGPGWIGFEHATPASLAHDLAAASLAGDGLTGADEIERRAVVDEALDAALGSAADAAPGSEADRGDRLAKLAEGVGFRDAVANAVDALRLAGLGPGDVGEAGLEDAEKARFLARVLAGYERGLAGRGRVDAADVFRAALAGVEAGAGDGSRILLLPELRLRGLAGRFLRALMERGAAEPLPGDPVVGLEAPPSPTDPAPPAGRPGSRLSWLHALDEAPDDPGATPETHLFAAGGPADEVREVLRRVIASGRRWDEVEIVAADPTVYGAALDALATRLSIPVTYAVGLPVGRTRQGRAAGAYLQWLQAGFPSETVRLLLQNGDLAPAGGDAPSGERLARRLRRLRIGWGRERWLPAIDRALAAAAAEADPRGSGDRVDPEELADRRRREREELAALRGLVAAILDATPPVPDRLGRGGRPISPGDLASGLLAFLERVPSAGPVEEEARGRLVEALESVAARLLRKSSFGAGLAILRGHLEIRVPSPGDVGPLPWSSAGGALHLADLDHGGWTGRAMTFVVGLDAERFPGAGLQDPILLDADRRRLEPSGGLPTSSERLAERRWALASLLARLRGEVTLSHPAWSGSEGRAVAPAAELLQAFRLSGGGRAADYEALREALAPLACPVPHGAARIDATDVWMAALSRGGLLLAGVPQVRAAHPRLDAGLTACEARASEAFTAWDGRIEPRPDLLDPRDNPDRVVSPSALQSLGTCPLRYLQTAVLGIRAPRDPELDPDRWLDPLQKGSLLHDVYETTLRRARKAAVEPADRAFMELALEVFERTAETYRALVPIPSRVVVDHEVERLRGDVLAFVRMTRDDAASGAEWIALEEAFGYGEDAPPPVEVVLPGGTILVRGRIDRVDRLPGGDLRIVDYKTGTPYAFREKFGVFHQGRRLQHVLYARAAEALHGARVDRMEYHFPTRKAQNHRAVYTAADLREGARVVDRLLDLVADGAFVPTEEIDDCTWCDHRDACGVRLDARGKVEASPRAAWGAARIGRLDAYAPLREVRALEEEP